MPITFSCSNCQARMSVPDQMAGKRGKCSKCKGVIQVPAAANGAAPAGAVDAQGQIVRNAPPPPVPEAPPEDVEAAALAALADEPKKAEEATDFVEFNCPQCDEQVKMGLDLVGKKAQCPSCRRIITVPRPAKKDVANWRDTGPNLPSAARRDVEPVPDDVWGTHNRTGPSHETLKKAGVIEEKRKPLTLLQKARPLLMFGLPVVLAVGCAIWLPFYLSQMTEKRALNAALAVASSEKGPELVGFDGLALLHASAGEYYLHSNRSNESKTAGSGSQALDEFGKALAQAKASNNVAERNALLLDMLPRQLELSGDTGQVQSDTRRPMGVVQKVLASTLGAILDREGRLEGVRRLTALLNERKDADRALLVTTQVYAGDEADRAEALAVLGLELLRAGNKDLAASVAKQALEPYAKGKSQKQPPLRAPVTILAVALGLAAPEPAKSIPDIEANRIGQAAGLAWKGQASEARQAVEALANPDVKFRALVEVADATGDEADVSAAFELLKGFKGDRKFAWSGVRLVPIGQRAKMSSDKLEAVAAAVPPPLTGWAMPPAQRARLASSRSVEGLDGLEKFPAGSLAAKVARLELARHNTGQQRSWSNTIRSWEEGPRALGSMGVALGMQGGK